MKTKHLVLTALLVSVGLHNAQETTEDPRKNLTFGLRAGFNNSNVYDERGENFVASSKLGFAGGAFVGIPIGRYLGVQPEILYSQKGYRSTGVVLGTPYSNTRTTNFLDVPVQLQFKPFRALTLLGGVQYSYLLSQQDQYKYGTNSLAQEQEFSNDNIRKNILGAVFGVDLHVERFVFSARYCWDLQNNAGDGTSSNPRYKNVWLQGTIGYRFAQ